MPFRVAQKTLERLEWPEIRARLAARATTSIGRARLVAEDGPPGPFPFEQSAAGVRERLAETAEARSILATGTGPPLGGAADVGPALARARKGGVLSARELLSVGATLHAIRTTAQFLEQRAEVAPRLWDQAAILTAERSLEEDIDDAFEPSGEVRDGASPALAAARREAFSLAGEVQRRIARLLRDPDTVSRLSDRYYTVRNDRFVLPVRADARGSVRGIVHDASGSGTTLFVEPEALVDLNNRHKRAEIEVDREIQRILRDLSARTAEAADRIETSLETLASIDLAFARGALSDELDATAPEVRDEGVLWLPQLRHPLLDRDRAVPNDVRLGQGYRSIVISGPNAGGKTVAMKACALAVLFVRAGLHVPAEAGARVDLFDTILADIGDEQDIRENLSTFSGHMANLARIVDEADERAFVALDEVGVGTDPGEGAAIAWAVLETLADAGARVIATTHYNLLKEMAEVDERFANASVEFDAETLAPTYRLQMGHPGSSSATAVAARMGLRADVLARANELLERGDRQLESLLSALSASRAELEHERREAVRLREETEAARSEYREKLERLQERRDKLYRAMREDLDRAFRDAHGKVAEVIRELQRGGSARDAARARERLEQLEVEASRAEEEAGVRPAPEDQEALSKIDWRFAKAGDSVRVRGGGTATLLALPDRRGRVAVRVGDARVLLPAERVGAEGGGGGGRPEPIGARAPRVSVEAADGSPLAADAPPPRWDESGRCDLRGLRVHEALDRLDEALDLAASSGRDRLAIVHGVGTGALRRAVRGHLAESRYVTRVTGAAPEEGGDGVTLAELGARD